MFKGQTALVTGSTSGIGLGIATALAAKGANVILNGFGDAIAIETLRAKIAADLAPRRTALARTTGFRARRCWSCREEVPSVPIRSASTRRCTKQVSSPTGSSAPRSAQSMPASSPVMRHETEWRSCASSGAASSTDRARLHALFHWLRKSGTNLSTVMRGIPAFFEPNPMAWWSAHMPLGIERAAYYRTALLRENLTDLVDLAHCKQHKIRLTVGAVNANSGEMRYFDSREETLGIEHVLASGALPPAFPAVRIDGHPCWDGGIYSNTPVEAVLDDKPRRDSVIFTVNVWNPEGQEPESVWQVMGRQKDIQFASRATSHIARQKQIHHLRHIIRELSKELPPDRRNSPHAKELASWGCGTTMHVARLVAPKLDAEDHTKDIDFTPKGIRARWEAGYEDTQRLLKRAPWTAPVDPIEGVVIHDPIAADGHIIA